MTNVTSDSDVIDALTYEEEFREEIKDTISKAYGTFAEVSLNEATTDIKECDSVMIFGDWDQLAHDTNYEIFIPGTYVAQKCVMSRCETVVAILHDSMSFEAFEADAYLTGRYTVEDCDSTISGCEDNRYSHLWFGVRSQVGPFIDMSLTSNLVETSAQYITSVEHAHSKFLIIDPLPANLTDLSLIRCDGIACGLIFRPRQLPQPIIEEVLSEDDETIAHIKNALSKVWTENVARFCVGSAMGMGLAVSLAYIIEAGNFIIRSYSGL